MEYLTDIQQHNQLYSNRYYENLRKLIRYFNDAAESGAFVISTAKDQRLIKEVNKELQDQLPNVEIVFLETTDENNGKIPEKTIIAQLYEIAKKKESIKGIIVVNLDIVLLDDPKALTYLNFQRESLLELNVPILIWLSLENITRMTREAIDLYSVRQQGIIEFDDITEYVTRPILETRFDEKYLTKQESEELQIRIELLERQLKEAVEKGYDKYRIVDDLVIPLIKAYDDNSMTRALELFRIYEKYFKLDNDKHLNMIARAEKIAGRLPKSIKRYNQLLELESIKYGNNSSEVAGTYYQLSNIYTTLSKNDLAVMAINKAISIEETRVNANPDLLILYLQQKGSILNNNGDLQGSLDCAQRALDMAKTKVPQNELQLANLYNTLGNALVGLGKHTEAISYLKQSLQIREAKLDNRHPVITSSYVNLSCAYQGLGDDKTALELVKKAENQLENNTIDNKERSIYTYIHLANILGRLGKMSEAINYYHKVIEVIEEANLGETKVAGTAWNNLGSVLQQMRKNEDAAVCYRKAEKIYKQLFQEPNPEIATVKVNIGCALCGLRNNTQALKYLTEGINDLGKLGLKHNLGMAYWHLAQLYININDYSNALLNLEHAHKILIEVLEDKNPNLAHLATLINATRSKIYEIQELAPKKKLEVYMPPSRNALCPCGSGRKYKRCHGLNKD